MKLGLQSKTLARKGLLIVAVPLLFGLLFIGILAFLLQQSQRETDREIHVQTVLSVEARLMACAFDAGIQMITWSLTKDQAALLNYGEARRELVNNFERARNIVGN